jgi:hypothetical protein
MALNLCMYLVEVFGVDLFRYLGSGSLLVKRMSEVGGSRIILPRFQRSCSLENA